MGAPIIAAHRPARPRELACAFLLLFLLFLAQTWWGNAFSTEWSGSGDEAAHYITGLMIHDYVRAGLPAPPMAFARNYYNHYPKVALGHWPPVYFTLQAAWTLLFGPSHISVLLLHAAIAALFFALSYALLRRWFAPWLAGPACLLCATSRIIAQLSHTLGSEILLSICVLAALLFLERYLLHHAPSAALAASVAALLAALTKGTAIMLAPLSLLMVALYGGWRLLLRPAAWGSFLLLAALTAPWYLLAPGAMHERVERLGGVGLYARAYRFKSALGFWPDQLGWIGFLLVAAGIAAFLLRPHYRHLRPFGYLALSVPVVMILCRLTIQVWEVRHFVAALPFVMVFLCIGAGELVHLFPTVLPARAAVALLLLALAALHLRAIPPKPHLGLDAVADHLAAAGEPGKPLLVVSDGIGEGALIAELAMREPRPSHRIDRGSKLLVTSDLMGRNVTPNFHSLDELLRLLAALPHRALILDDAPHTTFVFSQLREALHLPASGWHLEREFPRLTPAGEHRRILIWTRPAPAPAHAARDPRTLPAVSPAH